MINFFFKTFLELSKTEIYNILALRSEVFVVEQHCFYLDPDGKDEDAIHLMGIEHNELVAYLRIFLPNKNSDHVIFGRVLTASSVRSKGYGKRLIRTMLDYCENNVKHSNIHCSAQHYLKKFYESFGFKVAGDVYDDAGVPHIEMIKSY